MLRPILCVRLRMRQRKVAEARARENWPWYASVYTQVLSLSGMTAGSPSRPWLLQYAVEPIGRNFMAFTLKVMIIQPGPLCGVLRKVAWVHITCCSPLNTHCHCHSRLCLGSAWIVDSDRLGCIGNQVVIQARPCCPPAKRLSLSRVLKIWA